MDNRHEYNRAVNQYGCDKILDINDYYSMYN